VSARGRGGRRVRTKHHQVAPGCCSTALGLGQRRAFWVIVEGGVPCSAGTGVWDRSVREREVSYLWVILRLSHYLCQSLEQSGCLHETLCCSLVAHAGTIGLVRCIKDLDRSIFDQLVRSQFVPLSDHVNDRLARLARIEHRHQEWCALPTARRRERTLWRQEWGAQGSAGGGHISQQPKHTHQNTWSSEKQDGKRLARDSCNTLCLSTHRFVGLEFCNRELRGKHPDCSHGVEQVR
jgi:hypothetical protein